MSQPSQSANSNMPWEERPHASSDVVWRYSGNPIIPRDLIPTSNSIFNSAAVPFDGAYAGVFRVDNKKREMNLHRGFSNDGINWTLDHEPIEWLSDDPEISRFQFRYDPRVVWIEDGSSDELLSNGSSDELLSNGSSDELLSNGSSQELLSNRYWVTWCNGYHGPTIGVGYTYDFEQFHFLENALLPFNRNGVLFPRRINCKYVMLNRPSDNGHTPFGDIYLSQSKDMIYWGEHRFVMGASDGWQSTKIGAGPIPIETSQGWLLFYHGVITSCNGFVYSFGAALLDLEQPWKVIHRGASYLLSPQTLYECVGDVPNVAFPCAALYDEPTGRIAIYYGAADTVTALAFCKVEEVLEWLKVNSVN